MFNYPSLTEQLIQVKREKAYKNIMFIVKYANAVIKGGKK